jgi:hypothetical protein
MILFYLTRPNFSPFSSSFDSMMSYNNWTKFQVFLQPEAEAKLAEKLANDLKFNGSNPAELALGTIVT